MFGTINFKRFDRDSGAPGFDYKTDPNSKDYENNPQIVSMEKLGFNLHVSVLNYMAESVMLNASMRSTPTRIKSLLADDVRPLSDTRNYVIIRIYNSEVKHGSKAKDKSTQVTKTEIRVPGNLLNKGSVFIEELDCYLTTESNLEATRELIARDIAGRHTNDTVSLPDTMVQPDPVTLYHEYKQLVDYCILRQDKMNIRVGFDLRYGIIPDVIKNLHVSIMDHYFVPFTDNKLVFDPTLGVDEFIIENLHLSSKEEFRFTFSELAKIGVVYLDRELRDTLFGKFYGMALFASQSRYAEYVYQRRSTERFNEETLFVAERSGDPRLKEEIIDLSRDLSLATATVTELREEVTSLRADKKRLASDLSERERTITRLRDNHDAAMSAEAVMKGLDNESAKLNNESERLRNEREEQEFKEANYRMTQRAAMFKSIAEIMKSGWGIATACLGGFLAVLALLNKYNVKVTMG